MDTYENIQIMIDKNYKKNSRIGTVKGIIATIIFMGIDVYTLYGMFLGGNFTEKMAMGYSVLGAFMLDSLPFLFGISLAHILDSAIEKHKKRVYKWSIIIAGIFMLLVVVMYLAIRILIFFGGGDFNIGIQMLLGGMKWGSSYDSINAPDAFSALVPLVTSAVSIIVGLYCYVSEASFINQLLKETEKRKVAAETEVKKLQNELMVVLADAWTKLMPDEQLPSIKDYDKIMVALESSFKKRQSHLYKDIYINSVNQIYNEARNTVEKASSKNLHSYYILL